MSRSGEITEFAKSRIGARTRPETSKEIPREIKSYRSIHELDLLVHFVWRGGSDEFLEWVGQPEMGGQIKRHVNEQTNQYD